MAKLSRCTTWCLSLGVSLGAGLIGTNPLAAHEKTQASKKIWDLETSVITPTRSAETNLKTPYYVDAVSSDVIKDRSYRTLPQALRDIPGVLVQETAPGHGSPYIRGFTSFHNVMLIDGIRLNNSVFRSGPNQYWNTIDAQTVDQVEVVKGPASVLYGSDAIGGAVNVRTKSPNTWHRSIDESGIAIGGRLFTRASSAERSILGRAEASLTYQDQVGFYVGLTGRDAGDLESGSHVGRQIETGYGEYAADLKMVYHLNDDLELVAAHQRVRQNNVPRTHKTVNAKPFSGSTIGKELQRDSDQVRDLTYLQLHGVNLNGAIDEIHASLSFHRQQQMRHRKRPSKADDYVGFDVGTLGAWLQLVSETSAGRLTYGVEFYSDDVDSFSSKNPIQGSVGDDATYNMFGLYVQDQIDLSDRFELTLGGRLTHASADVGSYENPALPGVKSTLDRSWSAFVGSARGRYELRPDEWYLYGGISQGFRAPNMNDLTQADSARTDIFSLGSPDLDPETFISYELGTKWSSDHGSLQVGYYYTMMNDRIIGYPTGKIIMPSGDREVVKMNRGEGYINGIELAGSWNVAAQWTLFGNATFQDGTIDVYTGPTTTVKEPSSRMMPFSGQIGARWDAADRQYWVEGLARWADKADNLSSGDKRDTSRIPPGGTPGFVVLDLATGWQVTDAVDLGFRVDNVLDKDYRVHGSGHNMPGRNVILTLDVTF